MPSGWTLKDFMRAADLWELLAAHPAHRPILIRDEAGRFDGEILGVTTDGSNTVLEVESCLDDEQAIVERALPASVFEAAEVLGVTASQLATVWALILDYNEGA